MPGQNQAADGDQQDPAKDFHQTQVATETAIESKKSANPERSQHKGHRQSQRIDPEKKNALTNAVGVCRQSKNAGQDGADARGPTKSKGKAHQKSADRG